MGFALGQVLPLAIGIAISPVPIIASILLLLSPRAKTTGVGFLLGWIVGIALAATVFVAISAVLPEQVDSSRPVLAIVQLLLGTALIVLAARQWRSRPRAGEAPRLPKWMTAIDSMSLPSAAGLGLALAAVNPKNLLLAASAGIVIGGADIDVAATVLVVAVFTLLAGCTVLIPVLGYLIAGRRMSGPLDALREWLAQNNATIMSVVLLVLGTVVIGKGIAAF